MVSLDAVMDIEHLEKWKQCTYLNKSVPKLILHFKPYYCYEKWAVTTKPIM
jgi:hypothetical protein